MQCTKIGGNMSQVLPSFYIHNFGSPQLYHMPVTDKVSCWQLDSLSSDAVEVGGFHGYSGFFNDFMISYKKDGEAQAVFNGYTGIGGIKVATYTLQIYATSGVMGVQLLE
jgi:hypothetical protein